MRSSTVAGGRSSASSVRSSPATHREDLVVLLASGKVRSQTQSSGPLPSVMSGREPLPNLLDPVLGAAGGGVARLSQEAIGQHAATSRHLGAPGQLGYDVSACHGLPVGRALGGSRHGQGEAIGHLPQDYRPHRQPGDDAVRAGHDVTGRLLVDADRRLRGDVAARVAAQVLVERPRDDVRKLAMGRLRSALTRGRYPPPNPSDRRQQLVVITTN